MGYFWVDTHGKVMMMMMMMMMMMIIIMMMSRCASSVGYSE